MARRRTLGNQARRRSEGPVGRNRSIGTTAIGVRISNRAENERMALIVQKFGGTSVGDLDRIANVARKVAATKDKGNDVVVVVSAMAGETDRLIGLAKKISPLPNERELDALVSTGEQVSIALLAITLESMGYQGAILLRVADSADYRRCVRRGQNHRHKERIHTGGHPERPHHHSRRISGRG